MREEKTKPEQKMKSLITTKIPATASIQLVKYISWVIGIRYMAVFMVEGLDYENLK